MIRTLHSELSDAVWRTLGDYLQRPRALLVNELPRRELLSEWNEIVQLESRLDDVLVIGLVGGTGVGKSTLINALAGAEVSRSGDRRPTTDRVVAYIHRDAHVPAGVPTDAFALPHVQHRTDRLSKVLLLDFPDFDSAEFLHAQILQRYLPHLDVLLVVVDDVKYGDRRLYELLQSTEQATQNLYVILNKIDRLVQRYRTRAGEVRQAILGDLRIKLKEHLQIDLEPSHFFAVSAAEVLRDRLAASAVPAVEAPPNSRGRDDLGPGDFSALEGLLDTYQQAKHRRLVKEWNIDVRKSALIDRLRGLALNSDNRELLNRLRQSCDQSRQDLQQILSGTDMAIFGARDRRAYLMRRLDAAGEAWGLPFSLFLKLLTEISRWRDGEIAPLGDLSSRVQRHYRAYLEGTQNIRSRLAVELSLSEPKSVSHASATATVETNSSAALETVLRQTMSRVSEQTLQISRGTKYLGHLPALISLLAVAIAPWTSAFRAEDSPGVWSWIKLVTGLLNPLFLVNLTVTVVLAYLLIAGIIWLRQVQRADALLRQTERQIRLAVERFGQDTLRDVEGLVEDYEREWHDLEAIS